MTFDDLWQAERPAQPSDLDAPYALLVLLHIRACRAAWRRCRTPSAHTSSSVSQTATRRVKKEPVLSDLGDGPCGAGATAADAPKPVDNSVPINERVDAVEEFIDVAGKLLIVGDLSWAAVEADYRLLAINSALRRQMESMQAATVLARKDLGHLAVAFVRASLEDVMYLGFFSSLDLADSQ